MTKTKELKETKETDFLMHCGILDWILDPENDSIKLMKLELHSVD